jgi:acetyl esterase/lipase
MRTLSLLLLSLIALPLYAADNPQTIDVWPGQAPGETKPIGEEVWKHNDPGKPAFKSVTNVSKPTLTIFRPEKSKDTGVAVIVCPGGGYKLLMMDYEGEDCAKWLNSIGVTGIVLKYRVPGREGQPNYAAALQDAQRSIGLVRSKAAEWGIKPDHIGILGFSAGGHLSAAASTNYDHRTYDAVDDADKVSCRPDFSVLVYPGGVVKKGDTTGGDGSFSGKLSPEIKVTEKTPQAFLVMAHEDRVNSENCIYYYLALKYAKVPAEMHIYAQGAHGFGMRPGDKPVNEWLKRCEEWMRGQGILPAANGTAAAG